jgi:hypothetical protein
MTPDEIAARYLEVTEQLRALESEKDGLRLHLMANGSLATAYTVTVKESTSERIESLRVIRDKSPSLFEALHQAGAIKEVVSTRITVKLKGDNNV